MIYNTPFLCYLEELHIFSQTIYFPHLSVSIYISIKEQKSFFHKTVNPIPLPRGHKVCIETSA